MARALLGIAESAESEAVKLRAITEALDRAGMQAPTGIEVDVAVKPWQDVIAGMRGVRFGPRPQRSDRQPSLESPDDVVDAEVVEDGADSPARGRTRSKRARRREHDVSSSYDAAEPITGMAAVEEAARANREAGVYPTRRRRR
jgi:hypothetical protein